MVYYLFFIKNDNIVLRTILKFGGEYMFEFSTNFKKINGDRLTLSLIEEKLPTDFESLPYYYFDIILISSPSVDVRSDEVSVQIIFFVLSVCLLLNSSIIFIFWGIEK